MLRDRQTSPLQETAPQLAPGSSLVNRNVTVAGRRTSVRLEPLMWEALQEIAHREGCSLNELVTRIDARRRQSSLTAAIRVFIVAYYRAAATEDGHRRAGHAATLTRPYRTPAKTV